MCDSINGKIMKTDLYYDAYFSSRYKNWKKCCISNVVFNLNYVWKYLLKYKKPYHFLVQLVNLFPLVLYTAGSLWSSSQSACFACKRLLYRSRSVASIYCKIYRDEVNSAFHPFKIDENEYQHAEVKSGKGVAPSPVLVAVANEKVAFGSPSTAVDHFALLSQLHAVSIRHTGIFVAQCKLPLPR